jgi:hypothetical protein
LLWRTFVPHAGKGSIRLTAVSAAPFLAGRPAGDPTAITSAVTGRRLGRPFRAVLLRHDHPQAVDLPAGSSLPPGASACTGWCPEFAFGINLPIKGLQNALSSKPSTEGGAGNSQEGSGTTPAAKAGQANRQSGSESEEEAEMAIGIVNLGAPLYGRYTRCPFLGEPPGPARAMPNSGKRFVTAFAFPPCRFPAANLETVPQ